MSNKIAYVSTKEMIERLKDIISNFNDDSKVTNRHVSCVIRMNESSLNSRIARNSPPIHEIVLFCRRTGIDAMKILF